MFQIARSHALPGSIVPISWLRPSARALGLGQEIGTIEPGKACDLAIWDISDPADLVYRIGFNPLHARVKDGACC